MDLAAAPLLNVYTSHSGWSPLYSGPTSITGYRIFYGNEINASFPSAFTYVGLTLNNYSVGRIESVHSETNQPSSQLNTIISEPVPI